MMTALLCLQILTIIGLLLVLREMRKKPAAHARPAPASNPIVELRQNLCEVLKRHPSGWKHEGWVREQSAAWQRMYDTPGFALRKGEDIEEGQQ